MSNGERVNKDFIELVRKLINSSLTKWKSVKRKRFVRTKGLRHALYCLLSGDDREDDCVLE